MRVPSGDHVGVALDARPAVSWRRSVPSARTVIDVATDLLGSRRPIEAKAKTASPPWGIGVDVEES